MEQYRKYEIKDISAEQSALLIAMLSDLGFSGFEEGENELFAFGKASDIDNDSVKILLQEEHCSFSIVDMENQNWNAVWESNFSPVEVENFVRIRADFHESKLGFEYELLITPKMSFGTGHHATTYSVISMMRKLDFRGKSVCDYGSGTAVLAILAEKLGATDVLAIDNDDWCIENSQENIQKNSCCSIRVLKAETIGSGKLFDIILANINRNVLLEHMLVIANSSGQGANILLSGFYEEDVPVLLESASSHGLGLIEKASKNNWVCLHLRKLSL